MTTTLPAWYASDYEKDLDRAQSSSRGMRFALEIEWCPENMERILSGCCRDIFVTEDGYKPSPSRPCGVCCGELSQE
jgi:hypothetical protein